MKKFFYSMLFMAAAMMSAMSFVSCGSDDAEEVVAKEMVAGAVYNFSQDLLDLYNVKLTVTDANGQSLGNYNLNTMNPAKTDAKGVKIFEFEYAAKNLPISFQIEASCTKNVEDLSDDQEFVIVYGSSSGTYKEKGAGFDRLIANINSHSTTISGKGLKVVLPNGMTQYEHQAKDLIPSISTTVK